MPKGKRSELANDSVKAPGPGAYLDPSFNAYASQGRNSMTIKSRHATGGPMDNKNTNPGPGQYDLPT